MIPGLAMLRGYRRAWLPGDLLAGVTVAAYLVPQVMAYATIAGLPPVTGLWAAFPALIVYALLGSSRSLSMGPEATTALMTLVAIKPLAAGHPVQYAKLASTLALLTGLMALAAWLLRLGFFADLLSRPVLVGYLAGVALIMIGDQLQRATGVPVRGQVFFAQVGSFARGLSQVKPAVLALSLSIVAFLLLLRWRWPRLPGPLLAALLATAVVAALHPGGSQRRRPGPGAAPDGRAAHPGARGAARAAASRVHGADRGLQRRRGDGPLVREPRRDDRGEPGTAGAWRRQRRRVAGARVPGQ
jgi:MFS superfamily sulfate permease-like transporter